MSASEIIQIFGWFIAVLLHLHSLMIKSEFEHLLWGREITDSSNP